MKYDVTKRTPLLAHRCVAQNFSILTSLGRNCVAKWPIWWQKVGVTRGNCPIL